MTTREELRGAFNSIGDSMIGQFDPSDPEEVHAALIGAMSRHAAQARRTSRWMALAGTCDAYRDTVAALVHATNKIAAGGGHEALLEALGQANVAIDEVRHVLDTNACGTHAA